jgi:integrase
LTCRSPKQIKLIRGRDNEKRAYKLFNEMKAKAPEDVADMANLTVFDAFRLFINWSREPQKPASAGLARHFLQSFIDHPFQGRPCGKLRVTSLKPLHVTDWLTGNDWNPTTCNRAISLVKRALNWCVEQGVLTRNPLRDMKKPRERRRDKILTAEERQRIVTAVKDKAFTRFLYALGQTGARPGEIRTVTAAHVKCSANAETLYWELESKTTGRTGDSHCIYLTPGMAQLCRDLAREYPEGPLFRNTRGKPWTRSVVRIRFRNLRKRLGLDPGVVAYAFRHTFITDALEKGVPIASLAELAGHKDTRHDLDGLFQAVAERQHLADMAAKAAEESVPHNRVKDRMEQTGMRWTVDGAQAMLHVTVCSIIRIRT